MTYDLSKRAEILVAKSFHKSTSADIKTITHNVLALEETTNAVTAQSNGRIVSKPVIISLLNELRTQQGKQSIDLDHMLRIANGLAHREWVATIYIFHIIMAICIMCKHESELVEEYTSSEIMFRSPTERFQMENDVISISLERPIYTNKAKVDRIANALMIRNSVVLIGPPGVGKSSLTLALSKQIALGNYPLLYNSVVLLNPRKGDVDKHLDDQTGAHIICIISQAFNDLVSDKTDCPYGINMSRRPKFIYVVDSGTDAATKLLSMLSNMTTEYEKIEVNQPKEEETTLILNAHTLELRQYADFSYDNDVAQYIVKAADRFDASMHQPSKSIRLLTEVIFDKYNKMMLNGNKVVAPISVTDCNEEEYCKILQRVRDTSAYSILKSSAAHIHITTEDVEKFVIGRFKLTKEVLASMLSTNVREHLSTINNRMKNRVYGQDETIDTMVKSLWRRALKLDPIEKPVSFMLIGPTGVGKTFVTKILTEMMYGAQDKMVRFDMSEYMEKHEVSKLIGSPPGYIGSNQPGRLTEEVSKNPHVILLFDEIEKAHVDITNIFLQVLDDGRLTDNQGKTVDFSKTIIIMTSNIGCDKAYGVKSLGFVVEDKSQIRKETLKKASEDHFKPEFLNRIDKIIVMNELAEREFTKIIKTRLLEICKSCILKIAIDDKVIPTVLNIAKSNKYNIGKYNAREIKRVIVDQVENKIVDFMASQDIKDIKIWSKNGEIIISEAAKNGNTVVGHVSKKPKV